MNKYLVIAFLLFSAQTCDRIKPDEPAITENELRVHEGVLASDALAGRYPGTTGDSLAAAYIQAHFKAYGLTLPFNGGIQKFSVVTRVKPGDLNKLSYGSWTGVAGHDFAPYAFSSTLPLNAPGVFAWYGLQFKNDSIDRNDYKGADVKGKWCIILTGSPFEHVYSPTDREKVMLAKDKGAAGVIIITESDSSIAGMAAEQTRNEGAAGIPVLFVSQRAANKLLAKTRTNIKLLKKDYLTPVSGLGMDIPGEIAGSADIARVSVQTNNVVGLLKSDDPVFGNEYIVIGAHYDHLGMGGPGSSSRVQDTVAVHNGADDNASGVSVMLELAEKFAMEKGKLKRSILFAAFGAEEMGILGSKYLTEHLPVPAESISAMINLDMVGRLREDRSLQIAGTGTSVEAGTIISEANSDSTFKLVLSPEGVGPSDYSAFYGKNLPVFALTTGAHMDYHTPYDDADRINYSGMKEVGDFTYRLATGIINQPKKLGFREAGPKDQGQGRPRLKVTLGIMPDFASTESKGLRVDFVTKDKPAFRGGVLKGDIITAINELPVQNIQDYMYRLSKLNAGDTITVEVLRNGKKELLIIQL
ncbi:MAG: M20/M25/M40 family metallo-hydrolase [Bacteroidales bacterium]